MLNPFFVTYLMFAITCQNPEGWTPLHAAFNENDKSGIIDLLLSHGANINAQDKLGITPPMMGVLNGFSFKWDNFFKYNIDFALCDKVIVRLRSVLKYSIDANIVLLALQKNSFAFSSCMDGLSRFFNRINYSPERRQNRC